MGRSIVSTGVDGKSGGPRGRLFSEKQVLLTAGASTRSVTLGPRAQAVASLLIVALVGWSTFSAALVVFDTVESGNWREQADRHRETYESRIAQIAAERDARAEEARRAQQRFAAAMRSVSQMQSELLTSEELRSELERGLETVHATLQRTMAEREAAKAQAEVHEARIAAGSESTAEGGQRLIEAEAELDMLTAALSRTAVERDALAGLAAEAQSQIDDLMLEAQLTAERNERIFAELEEAVSVSVEPLDRMFRDVGIEPDAMIERLRAAQADEPAVSIRISTKGGALDPDTRRAHGILTGLADIGAYRTAVERAPFALPLTAQYRHSSGFGPRWGRMHEGSDFAGAHGSPILSTADGVVTFAGRQSGYGNLIKIKHAFGIETRYAHLSRIRVEVGQKVSRGDRIGDMGNTGRSTGTHLHYEVRVNGKAVDPMSYIEAAKDVL